MNTAHDSPAIEARALVKTYPPDVRALDGLDLDVPAGTVFGLLGPNGAGKSTTVKVLTALATPDSGSATVAGHDVLRHPDRVRRSIGVVGQRSAVDRTATGRENLVLQGRLFGMAGRALRQRVDELLEQLGLREAGDRIVSTWSGGMQRRLDVAIGLIHRPTVLFLDEPTTGLDPDVRRGLWDEIRRLSGEGITILLTTHYLDEADQLAASLAIVDAGRIVAEGSPDHLKAELRGEAIHVELATASDAPRAASLIDRLAGFEHPVLDRSRLSVRAERAAASVPSVMAALEGAGIGVAAVTVARPSLDDVYFRHTGRSYHAQLQEASR